MSAPSTLAVLGTLVHVTLRRLVRGRALWVSVVIAMLPAVFSALVQTQNHTFEPIELVITLVSVLLPPMFVAASLGEEIEDRTTTYLWSRPIGRWTIVIGKLLALAPVAMVFVVVGAYLAIVIDGQEATPAYLGATAAGSLAIATMAAGIATLVPKHGMALSIVYLVIFDLTLGAMPVSLSNMSITQQVRQLGTGQALAQPAIIMLAIAGVWLAVALWRIRRLES